MAGLQHKKNAAQNVMTVELTEREKEVLTLIAREMTTNEIADKLFLSFHTVETHRKNLISKLQVRNTAGLVKYAVQQGYTE
jgi:DNA-binding NarL/FixJ family response regulator